ncbi:MAG: FIST C-terminal domain-containing protein [Pseudomonadota bacterium]
MSNHTSPPTLWTTSNPDLESLTKGLEALSEHSQSLIIMACSNNAYEIDKLNALLSNSTVNIAGGMFPKLIFEHQIMDSGAIVLGLDKTVSVWNYSNLSEPGANIDALIHSDGETLNQYSHFIVFADALCKRNEDFIDLFYDFIGAGVTVIGGGTGGGGNDGGTGNQDFVTRPNIFTNGGVICDAIQIIGLPRVLHSSVGHGWLSCDGPYLITGANGYFIETIDYQPAFELYQDVVQGISDKMLTEKNFFDIAKEFPLGIADINGNVLVRDPINTDGRYLECIGNVPVNATVNILRASKDDLIQSAHRTASGLQNQLGAEVLMLFDCISRALYLESRFSDEISALQKANPQLPMFGALSLAEIASIQSSSIHLLNKSTVLGMF